MKTVRLLLIMTLGALAQDVLTNDSIVKMIKAGLGEGVIVSMIQNQPGKYAVTPDDMVSLKGQGVSEKVLSAMISKGAGGSAPAAPATVSAAPDSDLPKDPDIGVYFRKGGNWEEMLPEVVNWKTGGVLKHIATAGVVKGDVNGHLDGVHSRNSVATPLEVLIYVPEGVAITEYQLLHLHENPDSREFRTVTGGVMHESGGATRDVIPFEGKRVAKGVYKVVLPKMGAGEYGFLPPGAGTAHSSASIGKIYTFRLLE
ncbi:MAG: hypothetical protein P4L56_11895 [Candidatus Sulfopaludibacter sp.]|nr:hypothetical protein [Candidatus Sulfopaludibacter sp.]